MDQCAILRLDADDRVQVQYALDLRTLNIDAAKQQAEEIVLLIAMTKHKGNRCQAARELGIHRNSILRKLRSFGLEQFWPPVPGTRRKPVRSAQPLLRNVVAR